MMSRAFSCDGMALVLAQELVQNEEFEFMIPEYKQFALMPFMHSESRMIHESARRLFAKHTSAFVLDFELKHKAIIDQIWSLSTSQCIVGTKKYARRNRLFERK